MSSHIQQAGMHTGRSMALMVVVGLHALAITALITYRMAPEWRDPGPDMVPWTVFNEPVPPVPTADRTLADPTAIHLAPQSIPVPTPLIELPATSDAVAESVPAAGDALPGNEYRVPDIATVETALQYRIVRPTDDYYPNASLVQQESGTSTVRVCVDANGRIATLPTIEASSGHRRLDDAALRWARESLRFTPATRDGVAVPACKGFRVNFNLR